MHNDVIVQRNNSISIKAKEGRTLTWETKASTCIGAKSEIGMHFLGINEIQMNFKTNFGGVHE